MKVNKHISLDHEVVVAMNKFKGKNFNSGLSEVVNSYLRSYLGIDKKNKLKKRKGEADGNNSKK